MSNNSFYVRIMLPRALARLVVGRGSVANHAEEPRGAREQEEEQEHVGGGRRAFRNHHHQIIRWATWATVSDGRFHFI